MCPSTLARDKSAEQICTKGSKWEAKDGKKYFYFFTSNLYPSEARASKNEVDMSLILFLGPTDKSETNGARSEIVPKRNYLVSYIKRGMY